MPTPGDNLAAQQQLLYEIPDDQSSALPQNDTGIQFSGKFIKFDFCRKMERYAR
jgi:hypothetical protein